ncbi:hypothetical protein [Aquamicrobium soli]|uniref:Transcriptional regulator n=1 Tax=Aquamicrobium soli TaxID=1811518 RepID=A0ABV7KEL9_9HYPH
MIGDVVRMTEPKDRLRAAIADYDGPVDAWTKNQRALKEGRVGMDLMVSNCNGNRPISRNAAATYAKVFGHTAGWYLYGDTSPPKAEARNVAADTEAQLRAALLAFGVDRKSLPRAIAIIRAGFVKDEESPKQTRRDDQSGPANPRHAKVP